MGGLCTLKSVNLKDNVKTFGIYNANLRFSLEAFSHFDNQLNSLTSIIILTRLTNQISFTNKMKIKPKCINWCSRRTAQETVARVLKVMYKLVANAIGTSRHISSKLVASKKCVAQSICRQ